MLAAPHLVGPGGVQTYMLTVARQLERLGHGVVLWAEQQGEMAEHARTHGLRVAAAEAELPARCDGLLAQDAVTALTLAPRYPGAARAIVVHGTDYDLNLPPQLVGVVGGAVAMNAVTQWRVLAAAVPVETVRLRQPIDLFDFRPVGLVRARPRRVLLLGNYLDGPRRDELVAVCETAGVECVQIGRHGRPTLDPRAEIAQADVVVGQGRCMLEAMACGRAAWVFGPGAGDGWITAESYPAIEADGFRGLATDATPRAADFAAALASYEPEMGEVNRALITRHHAATEHAVALVGLLRRIAPAPPPARAVAQELARSRRVQYTATAALLDVQRDLRVAHERVDALTRAYADADRRAAAAAALAHTRRWRFVQAVMRPLDRLRGR